MSNRNDARAADSSRSTKRKEKKKEEKGERKQKHRSRSSTSSKSHSQKKKKKEEPRVSVIQPRRNARTDWADRSNELRSGEREGQRRTAGAGPPANESAKYSGARWESAVTHVHRSPVTPVPPVYRKPPPPPIEAPAPASLRRGWGKEIGRHTCGDV